VHFVKRIELVESVNFIGSTRSSCLVCHATLLYTSAEVLRDFLNTAVEKTSVNVVALV